MHHPDECGVRPTKRRLSVAGADGYPLHPGVEWNEARQFHRCEGTFARAARVKDIIAYRGDPKTFGFWPSVPLGRGLVELPVILRLLRDANYQGLLALEIDYLAPPYVEAGEDAAVAESISWLRNEVAALR